MTWKPRDMDLGLGTRVPSDLGTSGTRDPGACEFGCLGNWGPGDLGDWGHGNTGTWESGSLRTWGTGDMGTWDLGIWKPILSNMLSVLVLEYNSYPLCMSLLFVRKRARMLSRHGTRPKPPRV